MSKLLNDFWGVAKQNSNAGIYVVAILLFAISKELRKITVSLLNGTLGDCLVRLDVITSSILVAYFMAIVVLLFYADLTHAKFGWELAAQFNWTLTVFL